jgi:hypothetical protein
VADGRVERPLARALAGRGTSVVLARRPDGDPGDRGPEPAVAG